MFFRNVGYSLSFYGKKCNRVYEKIKNNKTPTQWWVCMLSYIAFNVIIISLVFI